MIMWTNNILTKLGQHLCYAPGLDEECKKKEERILWKTDCGETYLYPPELLIAVPSIWQIYCLLPSSCVEKV